MDDLDTTTSSVIREKLQYRSIHSGLPNQSCTPQIVHLEANEEAWALQQEDYDSDSDSFDKEKELKDSIEKHKIQNSLQVNTKRLCATPF